MPTTMEDPASSITYNPEPSPFTDPSDPSEGPLAPESDNALVPANPSQPIAPPRAHARMNLNQHRAHCTICHHPDRDVIEQAFLHWQRPTVIVHEFQLADRRVINRHARAFGLFELRASRLRRSLEFVMEQAETVKATADSVIRAVKAHACLSEDGRWTEPVKHTIITHQYADLTPQPEPAPSRQRRKPAPKRLGARTTLLGAALSFILPDSRHKGGA